MKGENRDGAILQDLACQTMAILFISGMEEKMGAQKEQGDDKKNPQNLARFLIHHCKGAVQELSAGWAGMHDRG